MEKECICLKCLYSNQPYTYFPIVCVQGKRIRELWHEIYNCKHFVAAPEEPEPPKQKPWQVIKCNEKK